MTIKECESGHEGYQLVIVGHSLGAAAAAILALTLRQQYPQLICLGYGMPASVFDWHTAQGTVKPCFICASVYAFECVFNFLCK